MRALDPHAFREFAARVTPGVLADPFIHSVLHSLSFGRPSSSAEPARENWEILLGEAEQTLRLLDAEQLKKKCLEIGGGFGIVYAWLRSQGVDITSVEPSQSGHDSYYQCGQRLMEIAGVPSDTWIALAVENLDQLTGQFDFIFSSNVLEHVSHLEIAFEKMNQRLAPGGKMLHCCPNYFFPYEPHFGIPLIPGFLKATGVFLPRSWNRSLWDGLNFVSASAVARYGRRQKMQVQFSRTSFEQVFKRLQTDARFQKKHPRIYGVYRLLRKVGIDRLIASVPGRFQNPLIFEARPSARA